MLTQEQMIKEYERMHKTQTFGGHSLYTCIPDIIKIFTLTRSRSIMDWGCGKGVFWHHPRIVKSLFKNRLKEWVLYEPAYPPYSEKPAPDKKTDGVIAIDVLEHVHPDHTDEFLDDIFSRANRFVYVNVSTQPASKKFSDGSNVHCNLRTPSEWDAIFDTYVDKYNVIGILNIDGREML
jgi:hypothetical protein